MQEISLVLLIGRGKSQWILVDICRIWISELKWKSRVFNLKVICFLEYGMNVNTRLLQKQISKGNSDTDNLGGIFRNYNNLRLFIFFKKNVRELTYI